jgi:C-lobe and N-lobe beta barrels of Tf-binding protein B
MRYFSLLALLAASTTLGGCPSPDGSALSLASSGSVCGVNSGNCATPAPTPAAPDPSNPVTPPAPPPNIGNDTVLATGNMAIALETSKLVSQKTDPAFTKLTFTENAPGTADTVKFEIDPKSPNSKLWPLAKTMEEYLYGSCQYLAGAAFTACMNGAGGGVGLGNGTYKEYRALETSSNGAASDESLQVWTWQYSYGAQYRNITAGGEATNQAWTVGGTKTAAAAMPTSGVANYNGKFGATAKTWGWIDSNAPDQNVSHNNIWRVNGASSLQANFATGSFSGVLTPEKWVGWGTLNDWNGPKLIDLSTPGIRLTGDYVEFMDTQVLLKGTIATSPTDGNLVTGTASADPSTGFVTNSTLNPMYAGFFGPNANEVSGVFNYEAVSPYPWGSRYPINDDRRAYIEMSGIFNGQ